MRKKQMLNVGVLKVYAAVGSQSMHLGDLSYTPKYGSAVFQWSQDALQRGLEWSPLRCPLSNDLWVSGEEEAKLLNGLPGFIHDALPDGWGELLMDRAFSKAGIPRSDITPMLRLAFLADRTWGALSFEPKWETVSPKNQKMNLQKISEEAKNILEGDLHDVSQELIRASGGLQGARPKVFVALDHDNQHALAGYEQLPAGFRHTIVKFAGHGETPSHVILEQCYLDAARQCNVVTMPSVLLDLQGTPALCVDRFDRAGDQKIHVHSMAGMLHTSHTIPNADWIQVADILDDIKAPAPDKPQALRRALFNMVFCVRDDHTKNLAFQMDDQGKWSLAPAFDIAYSAGPRGYHTMMYDGHQGQHVETKDVQRLCARFDVPYSDAKKWIEEMQSARSQMLSSAKSLGVSQTLLHEVKLQFKHIDQAVKKAPSKKLIRV